MRGISGLIVSLIVAALVIGIGGSLIVEPKNPASDPLAEQMAQDAGPNDMRSQLRIPLGASDVESALRSGDAKALMALIASGLDPNERDTSGETLLNQAVASGKIATVEVLLAAGADPEAEGRDGRRPVSVALANGFEAIVDLLVKRGAAPPPGETADSQQLAAHHAFDGFSTKDRTGDGDAAGGATENGQGAAGDDHRDDATAPSVGKTSPDDRPRASSQPPAIAPTVSPRIAVAQRLLLQLGYDPGPVDGLMGKQTRTAVQAFQKDFGLPPDGRVSDGFLTMLNDALYRQGAARELAVPPAPAPEEAPSRGFFGSFLGGLQWLLGGRFDSVAHPDEFRQYCKANGDTWIYDFGRERFVYCGHVDTGGDQ